LLRETLTETRKVALAYVILHTRQHLAALMPIDSALVLILLRWPSEVRSLDTLALTKSTTDAALSKTEKEMAKRLVSDMAGKWQPEEYRDSFHDQIMALVETKASKGEIENVEADVGEAERKTADIIDLTELLKRSLGGGTRSKTAGAGSSAKKSDSSNASVKKLSKASATKAKPKAKAVTKSKEKLSPTTEKSSPGKSARTKSAR
jgi:DNA end-binding protein Ku